MVLKVFGKVVSELLEKPKEPTESKTVTPSLQERKKDEQAKASESKVIAELRSALLAKQDNLLRAWRIYFDQDGDLCCSFRELCAGCAACNFKGDVVEFINPGVAAALTFSRVAPALCTLLERFRVWVKSSWDGPGEMFEAIDSNNSNHLSYEEFKDAVERAGFVGAVPGATMKELFEGFDLDNEGFISKDEVAIAESDENERRTWMRQIRHEKEQVLRRELAKLADSACGPENAKLQSMHRLADRAWLLDQLPKVPRLEANRRKEKIAMEERQREDCLALFHQHLVAAYGCVVRAWRRALDPNATFEVSKAQILRYCRCIDFRGSSRSLWAALDQDCDGFVRLQELDPHACDVLAFLANWAQKELGGCARLWDILAHENKGNADHRLHYRANKVTNRPGALAFALDAIGYPHASDTKHMHLLTMGLDHDGCGFVGPADFAWLESWDTPPWLGATPDYDGLDKLRKILVKKYGHLLKAWRTLMDTRRENRVSWESFFEVFPSQLKPQFAGVWRALDSNLDGWVTLAELDPVSHEMVYGFKMWVDTHFGSSRIAFDAIDGDGSGEVTLSELKRACRRLKWEGDVTLLFCCLDSVPYPIGMNKKQIAISRSQIGIYPKDVEFLDSYKSENADFSGSCPVKRRNVAGAESASESGSFQWGSRPTSQGGSRPASQGGSRPPQGGSRPTSQGGSRPVSQSGSRPVSQSGSRPVSQKSGSRPASQSGHRSSNTLGGSHPQSFGGGWPSSQELHSAFVIPDVKNRRGGDAKDVSQDVSMRSVGSTSTLHTRSGGLARTCSAGALRRRPLHQPLGACW